MSDEFDDLLGGTVEPERQSRRSLAEQRIAEVSRLAEIRLLIVAEK